MEFDAVDAVPLSEEMWPAQIENKYYAVRLLTHWVCDGNLDQARAYLRGLLDLSPPTPEQRRTLAWELNVLLCNRAHEYKVGAMDCENLRRDLERQIWACGSADGLEALLDSLVERYCRLIRERTRLRYSDLIRNCLEFVDAHFPETLTLSGEAARLHVSPSYLSARFSMETGQTFIQYVNDVRLRHACLLLGRLKRPIGQVAQWCGFPDSNYFARVFRARYGMSPSQYRARQQTQGAIDDNDQQ